MRECDTTPAGHRAHLVLDCGLDEQAADPHLTLDERGMRFFSQWQFSLGTQLAVNCHYEHPQLGLVQVRIEGIVVWCERRPRPVDQAPVFDTTILFLELPDKLRQSVRDFSCQLAAAA
jgi:hypothetical protein